MSKLQGVLPFSVFIITGALGFNSIASGLPISLKHQDVYQKQENSRSFFLADSTSDRVGGIFTRPRQRGGSRSGSICFISPNPDNSYFRTSWSLQPLFAWQDYGLYIEQLELKERETGNLFWSHMLNDLEREQKYIIYNDTSLTPKGRYTLIVTYLDGDSDVRVQEEIDFETLERPGNLQIQLDSVDSFRITSGIQQEQEIALQRAEIFIESENELGMDMLRELFPIQGDDGTPNELQSSLEENLRTICEGES